MSSESCHFFFLLLLLRQHGALLHLKQGNCSYWWILLFSCCAAGFYGLIFFNTSLPGGFLMVWSNLWRFHPSGRALWCMCTWDNLWEVFNQFWYPICTISQKGWGAVIKVLWFMSMIRIKASLQLSGGSPSWYIIDPWEICGLGCLLENLPKVFTQELPRLLEIMWWSKLFSLKLLHVTCHPTSCGMTKIPL